MADVQHVVVTQPPTSGALKALVLAGLWDGKPVTRDPASRATTANGWSA
jgi:hypothetical protein